MLHPATRGHFLANEPTRKRDTTYHAAVRIPIGTALGEELIFRSALLAVFARRRSHLEAAVLTSLAFGVWHVLPSHDALGDGPATAGLRERPLARVGAVLGHVAFTTAAGLGFSWLRFRTRSVAAPVVTHAVVNTVAFAQISHPHNDIRA